MAATELIVNGRRVSVESGPGASLLSALRDQLDLTGSKYGCGEGQCGACTVLVDGAARRSCITPVASVAGRKIVTIEGLAEGDRLHPLQQAFLDEEAMQCAYCTPGMIMSGVALLQANRNPSEQRIIEHMHGNVCRCGTYPRIVLAVRRAAKMMQGSQR